MGSRGPVPKRSDQRRRRNKPSEKVTDKTPAGRARETPPVSRASQPAEAAAETEPAGEVRKANARWHPVAKRWFESLSASGQSKFYEPSDWATAELIAESISRELKPQVVGVTKDGEAVMVAVPPKGQTISAWLKGMSVLLVTEGDRRRMQLELQRPDPAGEEAAGDVSEIDEYRRRLRGDGSSG
jgi:hypothetical protein